MVSVIVMVLVMMVLVLVLLVVTVSSLNSFFFSFLSTYTRHGLHLGQTGGQLCRRLTTGKGKRSKGKVVVRKGRDLHRQDITALGGCCWCCR